MVAERIRLLLHTCTRLVLLLFQLRKKRRTRRDMAGIVQKKVNMNFSSFSNCSKVYRDALLFFFFFANFLSLGLFIISSNEFFFQTRTTRKNDATEMREKRFVITFGSFPMVIDTHRTARRNEELNSCAYV